MRLPVPLAVAALLGLGLLLERLIVTDEEAIGSVLEDAASSFERGEWERFGALVDPEYVAGGRDRERVLAYAEALQRLYRPSGTDVDVREVHVDGDEATARVRVWTLVTAGRIPLDLSIRLVRREEGWRIRGADLEGFGLRGHGGGARAEIPASLLAREAPGDRCWGADPAG